ncbi:MAG: pitrilysin family protein [Gammaproteobacteria bacterium]
MHTSITKRLQRLTAAVLLLWLFAVPAASAMPAIQHWVTDNGTRVYFVAAPELPMVNINVTFAAGSARDDGHAGVANMTSTLLDMGAAGLSADEIASRAESLGAELATGSARDMAWVTLRSLSDAAYLQPALKLLADVINRPDFNEKDFARERERTLVAIRRSEQSPATVAEYTFFSAVYGNHPYATRPGGTVESVGALQLEQIKAFYKRYYVARNAVFSIIGDLDRKAAGQLVEQVIAQLPAGKRAAALQSVPVLTKAQEQHVYHPSTQTHVNMGAPGMHRGDPDYFALYVGNHVLGGGGLVSRLFEEVREKRGLSYSVNSNFSPMEQNGPYMFSLQTRNDQVDESLVVMRETLQDFVDKGPTEKELIASKKNITGGFPLRIASNSSILDYLTMIGFYDLPLDYLEVFNDRVMAVTRAQIIDAFQRRVAPDTMVTIIVGGDS